MKRAISAILTIMMMLVITKIYPSQFNDPKDAIDIALEKLDIGYIDMMLLHHPET